MIMVVRLKREGMFFKEIVNKYGFEEIDYSKEYFREKYGGV